MRSDYVLQSCRAICTKCGHHMRFLVPAWPRRGEAMFYICFKCNVVVETGKGKVTDVDQPSTTDTSADKRA